MVLPSSSTEGTRPKVSTPDTGGLDRGRQSWSTAGARRTVLEVPCLDRTTVQEGLGVLARAGVVKVTAPPEGEGTPSDPSPVSGC